MQCDTKSSFNRQCVKTTKGSGTSSMYGITCGSNKVCSGTDLQCCGGDTSSSWCCPKSGHCGKQGICLDFANHTAGSTSTQTGIDCSSIGSKSVCAGTSLMCCNKAPGTTYCCNSNMYNGCGTGGLSQCVKTETSPGSAAEISGDKCTNTLVCLSGNRCCGSAAQSWCCPTSYQCSATQFKCIPMGQMECKQGVGDPVCCQMGSKCCGMSCCFAGQTCKNGQCTASPDSAEAVANPFVLHTAQL
ncbi:unnamed protein product [Symbiodinium natans]|uniref:Uncharacterized protein n=1 Tax=Symbiodinium natans TaxID=878477 RepID=A0A812IH07_9DINO|nr:unnamed protein product [Symbiodinium natans]